MLDVDYTHVKHLHSFDLLQEFFQIILVKLIVEVGQLKSIKNSILNKPSSAHHTVRN